MLGGIAVGARWQAVRTRLVETVVRFKRLEPAELDDYLACGEWRGKAGGYAIQGRAARFIAFVSRLLQQCRGPAAVRGFQHAVWRRLCFPAPATTPGQC